MSIYTRGKSTSGSLPVAVDSVCVEERRRAPLLARLLRFLSQHRSFVTFLSKEKIRQKKAEKEARRRAAEDSSAKEPGRSVTVDSAEEGAESATRREGGPSQVADGDRAGLREQDEALGRNEAEDERRKRSGDEETEGSREGKDKADFFSFKDANEGDQGHEASQGGRQMKNILLHEQLLRKPGTCWPGLLRLREW